MVSNVPYMHDVPLTAAAHCCLQSAVPQKLRYAALAGCAEIIKRMQMPWIIVKQVVKHACRDAISFNNFIDASTEGLKLHLNSQEERKEEITACTGS